MARRFVKQFGDRESVDEVFLASEKQLRSNRNGNLYLQMRLTDKTGSVTGMLWNANEDIYGSFENGDYLRVQGKAQVYNGALQMIVSNVDRVGVDTIDESDFVTLNDEAVGKLTAELSDMLRAVKDYHLRNLAECFLMDEKFMRKFSAAPAGVKLHHAYQGGLLQHVVSLMRVANAVAPHYPYVDNDLLLLGAFLHDAAKIDELTYDRDLGYSDEGQLVGHLVMAVGMLEEKVRQAQELSNEDFPEELMLRLKHMIVSHHGQYEFGSPKLPMTPEAIALHYLDTMDAKLYSVDQILSNDINVDSRWTPYEPNLGRKLFKGDTT